MKPVWFEHISYAKKRAPPYMEGVLRRAAVVESTANNIQQTTFVIGESLIHAASAPDAFDIRNFTRPISTKLQPLWPLPTDPFLKVIHGPVHWPPESGGLNDQEVDYISKFNFNDAMAIGKMPFRTSGF